MDKKEFWKRCDPEMREFLLDNEEVRQYLTAFDGKVTGTTAPEGVLVFPETEWESRGYWSR